MRHPGAAGPIIVGGAYPDFAGTGLRETHRQLLGADAAGIPDLHHLDAELGEVADEIIPLDLSIALYRHCPTPSAQ